MSDLLVAVFDDEYKGEQVRVELLRMEREHLVDLEDAVVLIRTKKGKVKLHHVSHLTVGGAISGGFLGVIVGAILLNPLIALLGLAAGSAVGAVSGSASHAGINEDFMKEMATHLKTNSSALCVLGREHPESVLEELHQFGGKVLRCTLTHEDESKLLETLDHLKADMSF